MTAGNQIARAVRSLEALRAVLEEAAARQAAGKEFVEEALVHLEEAARILDTMTDEEGTE